MLKKKKKGKSARQRTLYPGLEKKVNLKSRIDLIDYDYLDKLTPKEKLWLSNFTEEYISGNFKHRGKPLHITQKEKKECYDRNNARNRDTYTKARLGAGLDKIEEAVMITEGNPEEAQVMLIDMLDEIKKTKLLKAENYRPTKRQKGKKELSSINKDKNRG